MGTRTALRSRRKDGVSMMLLLLFMGFMAFFWVMPFVVKIVVTAAVIAINLAIMILNEVER
jgi:hypothetical protein